MASEFDIDLIDFQSTAPPKLIERRFYGVTDKENMDETLAERKLRMLRPLSLACTACSMCELGRKGAERSGIVRDPHVFSSMTPSLVMVIGQNPGWEELRQGKPFVGQAGQTWDTEIAKHEVARDEFYICNTVRCFTQDNQTPSWQHISRCSPFLRMELQLLRPKLVVTLGNTAFQALCEGHQYSDCLGKITESTQYEDVKVFAVFHPSPLNLADRTRKAAFQRQVATLCALVKRLRE